MTNPGAVVQPQMYLPFSLSLTPSGGGGPYSWSETGLLPAGLSFVAITC